MSVIREGNSRRDQVVASIRILLENQGIDSGSDWDIDPDSLKKLNELADGDMGCMVYSGDLGITQGEDETKLIFAVASSNPDFFRHQLPREAAKALMEPGTKTIQLVFFVRNMQSRISLETRFDPAGLKALREAIKEAIKKEDPTAASQAKKKYKLPTNYVLLQEYAAQDIRLTDLHPLEMLHEPPVDRNINMESDQREKGNIQARVFTVDLYQLVQKYNLIGDTLFQNNVRFGISDTLGVEQSMRETLASEPENFWFKNNGVTFLIQNSRTFLQETKTVFLGKLDPDNPLPFSVINGAQTITTASRYFFALEARADTDTHAKQELAAAKRKAHVLVRVINVTDTGTDDATAKKNSRAISVALNRQKPIRVDDIAFTHPAVLKLAEYLRKMNGVPFTLIRQGETAADARSMDLISFARARMACTGRPGVARTKGRDDLLKTSEDGSARFAQAGLFSSDWLDAEGEDAEAAIFQRDYNAVWFAHKLVKAYEAEMRKFESVDAEILNAVRNGKWYFTAIVTQIKNNFQSDYSNFLDKPLSNLPQLMESFAEVVVAAAHAVDGGKEINSNLFKSDRLYNEIIDQFNVYLAAHPLSIPVSDDQISQLIAVENFPSMTFKYIIDISKSYVVLDGQYITVATDGQALVEIAKHILTVYPASEKDILSECSSWFTIVNNDVRRNINTFWKRGNRYSVDTNTNWEDKRRRMKKMCRVANVKHDTIGWHKAKDDTYTFFW